MKHEKSSSGNQLKQNKPKHTNSMFVLRSTDNAEWHTSIFLKRDNWER